MSRKQTLTAAVQSAEIRRALNGLVGCPKGGWPETQQALQRLDDAIPHAFARSYDSEDLIQYALAVNYAERYAWKPEHSIPAEVPEFFTVGPLGQALPKSR